MKGSFTVLMTLLTEKSDGQHEESDHGNQTRDGERLNLFWDSNLACSNRNP